MSFTYHHFVANNGTHELQVYNNNDGKWYNGSHLAKFLRYVNDRAPFNLVRPDDKKKVAELIPHWRVCGIPKKTVFVNEAGLQSVLLSSTKPEAKEYKQWVIGILGSEQAATTGGQMFTNYLLDVRGGFFNGQIVPERSR